MNSRNKDLVNLLNNNNHLFRYLDHLEFKLNTIEYHMYSYKNKYVFCVCVYTNPYFYIIDLDKKQSSEYFYIRLDEILNSPYEDLKEFILFNLDIIPQAELYYELPK